LIRKQLFWLSGEEWGRLEPLLPKGRRGARRVDDRRVISGIVHMLGSGARWRAGVRPLHDDLQPLQPMEPPRHMAGHVQGGHREHRRDQHRLNRQFARQGTPLGSRRKRMARPVGKRLEIDGLISLQKRIRPFGEAPLAKMEIRAS